MTTDEIRSKLADMIDKDAKNGIVRPICQSRIPSMPSAGKTNFERMLVSDPIVQPHFSICFPNTCFQTVVKHVVNIVSNQTNNSSVHFSPSHDLFNICFMLLINTVSMFICFFIICFVNDVQTGNPNICSTSCPPPKR